MEKQTNHTHEHKKGQPQLSPYLVATEDGVKLPLSATNGETFGETPLAGPLKDSSENSLQQNLPWFLLFNVILLTVSLQLVNINKDILSNGEIY